MQPRFAGLLFAVVLGPDDALRLRVLPVDAALDVLGPLQYLFLLNPLVFMSEAMRLAVTPEVPHMPVPLMLGGLALYGGLFLVLGARTFEKRTIL